MSHILSTHESLTAQEPTPYSTPWKLLGLLIVYRLVISAAAALLVLGDQPLQPLGQDNPALFSNLSLFYLAFSMACAVAHLTRWPGLRIQVYAQILIDITVITLMMHASGGVNSGLGILLVVAVAAGAILSPGRIGIFFASVASLAILIERGYSSLAETAVQSSYAQTGMLGAAFFATALLIHALARRALESEALATQRGADLANMAEITQYVIEHMQTGIVVLDNAGRIRIVNESAHRLLGPSAAASRTLTEAAPALARQWSEWHEDGAQPSGATGDFFARFAKLGAGQDSDTLIFLEDNSGIAQQAQQLKLASLGRLTASIAHEIRNPLGAISHAGQLLAESPALQEADRRLTQIISDHARRMNNIVENVLQLSRRERTRSDNLDLESWLDEFVRIFCESHSLNMEEISVQREQGGVSVRADSGQLHQVLWNLCQNGLRYAPGHARPKLTLRYGILPGQHVPYLDVIDAGPGISAENAEHIFEPFFTTESNGTGLGLYIARELCECNQAHLKYIRLAQGSCFRITFADRRRQIKVSLSC
ncbi:MAG: ATP-binding protein, partial [Gammaproteobacteria bacterium]|nr:ATP-binding protein [Gammaproteobacteria bacterium]